MLRRRRQAADPEVTMAALRRRVTALEEAVAESRRLHQRLVDVVDVVAEVLVPAGDLDDTRLVAALESARTGAPAPQTEKAQRSL